MVGVITLYQDWWPFLVAIGYVVVQHGLAGVIAPGAVYDHRSAVQHPWEWAGIHGVFILGMSAAGIASWRLNESFLASVIERQEQLEEAQEVAHLGGWERDLATDTVTWSPELYRLLGLEPDTVVPGPDAFFSCIHPDDVDALRSHLARLWESGTAFAADFRVIRPEGTGWLHCRAKATAFADGKPCAIAGTMQDLTDRKEAESAMQQALSLLSATLDATADGILVVDQTGKITSFNQRFAELWRLPPHILASGDDDQALAFVVGQVADPEAFVAKVRELYAQPDAESEDVIEFRDGRTFERFSTPQRVNGDIVGRVWSFRDVTERTRLERELSHQAFHDSLTNLANQALFRDRVDHALVRATRNGLNVGVLFLDLDNFKNVNDSLGHTAGDELLVAVAERLRGSLRATDTAARLGGDEFAVLIEDVADPEVVTATAARLIAAMQQPFVPGEREIFVSASIGVAFGGAGSTSDQLLRNGDLAMYTAKRRGKGCFEAYRSEMHTSALERLEMEADLRRAVHAGQLQIDYQPILTLPERQVVGVEALVRWQHPERGLLGPMAFIPLAEETGIIREIGRHVLSEACTQTRHWQLASRGAADLSVHVNVSAHQLNHDDLVDHARAALESSGLPPASLVLEFTETAMMHDTDATIAKLYALKALGVRLAIDDFGTGYSSLSYLQRFPVDALKIDRAFMAGLGSSDQQSSLASAIVSLAGVLGLHAVAEGVETDAQASTLAALGCSLGQGFLFSRPVDAETIGRLLGAGTGARTAPITEAAPATI
jgi:diguanylate cyclase (GGDEF)-like protein/PAS domain S-box-containing protein